MLLDIHVSPAQCSSKEWMVFCSVVSPILMLRQIFDYVLMRFYVKSSLQCINSHLDARLKNCWRSIRANAELDAFNTSEYSNEQSF